MGILQIVIFFKLNEQFEQLKLNNISINRWSSYAAVKDLKNILKTTDKETVKEIVMRMLQLQRAGSRVFFGTLILIALLFILNGIFEWEL
jgi:hypothetical protein